MAMKHAELLSNEFHYSKRGKLYKVDTFIDQCEIFPCFRFLSGSRDGTAVIWTYKNGDWQAKCLDGSKPLPG